MNVYEQISVKSKPFEEEGGREVVLAWRLLKRGNIHLNRSLFQDSQILPNPKGTLLAAGQWAWPKASRRRLPGRLRRDHETSETRRDGCGRSRGGARRRLAVRPVPGKSPLPAPFPRGSPRRRRHTPCHPPPSKVTPKADTFIVHLRPPRKRPFCILGKSIANYPL